MNKFLNKGNPSDCCGCSACVQKCPMQCLSIVPDKDGFLFPQLVKDSCINCGLCTMVCPLENEMEPLDNPKFYGAYSQNFFDITNSSSGGIYPSLARWVISQRGIVYGAMLDTNHDLYHIGVTENDEVKKTLGSKYFQSEIKETYKECKANLESGRVVLFTGTPCQIHGLKCFLHKDYEHLYTADVICHGVPSKKMFDAYVAFLEKRHNAKFVDINFRDKKRGWSNTSVRYTMEDATRKRKDFNLLGRLSEYYTAFIGGSIARESCYKCPYSSLIRTGDITMGDFWGYQAKRPDLRHEDGLSLVLCNTDKGRIIVDALSRMGIVFKEVDEECIRASENKNLFYPTRRPELRDKVYKELEDYGFEYIAANYYRRTHTLRNKLKNIIPAKIVKLIQRISYTRNIIIKQRGQ